MQSKGPRRMSVTAAKRIEKMRTESERVRRAGGVMAVSFRPGVSRWPAVGTVGDQVRSHQKPGILHTSEIACAKPSEVIVTLKMSEASGNG